VLRWWGAVGFLACMAVWEKGLNIYSGLVPEGMCVGSGRGSWVASCRNTGIFVWFS
jgi:hypothetical protein